MLAPSMDAATKGATLCAPKSFIPYLPHQGVKVQSRLYVILEIDRCRFVGLCGLGILITSVHPQLDPQTLPHTELPAGPLTLPSAQAQA